MKIIYILGSGHSGSTLFDKILGTSPQAFSGGELIFLEKFKYYAQFEYFKKSHIGLCNCGEKLWDCPVWENVVEDANLIHFKFDLSYNIRSSVNMLLCPPGKKIFKTPESDNLEFYRRIESAIHKGGIDPIFIVDSSKDPRRFYDLLWSNDQNELEIIPIHLIRDGREYLHSFLKKSRKGIKGGKRRNFLVVYMEWVLIQFFSTLLMRKVKSKKARISYKDLTNRTEEIIGQLNDLLTLDLKRDGLEKRINKSEYHIVNGNSMRFRPISEIKYESRWRNSFPNWVTPLLTILFFPFNWAWNNSKFRD